MINMNIKVEGKIYEGKERSREIKCEGHAEKHVRARDITYVAVPY